MVEDAWGQDVAADNRQRRRGILGFRLLDDGADLLQAVVDPAGSDDAIAARIGARHVLHAEYRAAVVIVGVRHLLHDRRLAVEQVVGKQYRERFVADHRFRTEHGVAEPERLRLADVDAVDVLRDHVAHEMQQLALAPRFEFGFQFVGLIEMVFDGPLRAPGNEDHVGDSRRHSLLDRILDQGFVYDGQHFLRARLGRREETGPQPRDRKDGLSDFLHFSTPSLINFSKPASSRIATPNSRAFSSFEPASAPATT